MIPVLIPLKRQLAVAHSPVLGALMKYLAQLFVDYRDDVEQFLLADKSTGEEVLYDLRQAEEAVKDARKKVCDRCD